MEPSDESGEVAVKYLQLFRVEGEDYPSSYRSEVIVHGELQPPFGLSYFCPTCAVLWAKVKIVGQDSAVITRKCEQCGDGTLWIPWDHDFNVSWPRELLQREFNLMLRKEENE